MENVQFRLITASDAELFEQRLSSFIDSLDRSDLIVDVKFSTAPHSSGGVEFSALVHFQRTESWS